jgi:hypothetical protein
VGDQHSEKFAGLVDGSHERGKISSAKFAENKSKLLILRVKLDEVSGGWAIVRPLENPKKAQACLIL